MIQIYLNLNEDGKVISWLRGRNIIPQEPYDLFFLTNETEAMEDEELTVEKCREWQEKSFG